MPGYNLRQRAAGRVLGRFARRLGARRMMGRYARKRMGISRQLMKPGEPTFTETFKVARQNVVVPIGGGTGSVFKVRFNDIPQWLQYNNLYTQYRINWIKVMLIPQYNTDSSDYNAAESNAIIPAPYAGMARIVYAIQNSPNVQAPAAEDDVLQENGCKIKAFKSKWSCSFKPVPDVTQSTATGQIYTRQKFRQWFNIDTLTTGNNPEHGAVTTFISLPGGGTGSITYFAYFKVNFTLRDPK